MMETDTLENMCELIVDCPHFTPRWTDAGVIVTRNQNIRNGRLDISNPSYTDEETYYKRIKRAAPNEGDLIFTREAPMGEICMVPAGLRCCLGQRQVLLRPKNNVDSRYMLYAMQSPFVRHQIFWSEGTGSTVSNVRLPDLRALKIPRNGELEQSISKTLGALDDKIENNRRMNETLEEMARAIFKSWFVDFDPVHAKDAGNAPAHMDADTAALFPSSFGNDGLPVGWSVGTYGDAMSIYDSKRVPLSKHQREKKQGVFPYYGATSCMDHVDEYLFDGIYLLMGEDGSVVRENGTPFLQYVWGKFWVNNHAHVLQGANGFSTEHLFCGLSSVNVTPYVTGAVQLKINQANMKRIPIVLPTQPILSAFSDRVLPLFNKRRLNIEENQTLANLRDTLLPKLMSGEIRVKDAEQEVEAAV